MTGRMRVLGLGALRRAADRLRPDRRGGRPLILMYHRIADAGPDPDPWQLSVSPKHFAEHLEVLRREAVPVPLSEITSDRPAARGRRAVVVTFDDGYADNLHAAAPLLHRHDVPATVFVTTGALGNSRPLWWDELAAVLLTPGRLPDTLELRIAGRTHRWTLGPTADYDAGAFARYRGWSPLRDEPPTARQATYLALWILLSPLPADDQRRLLDDLAAWAGGRTVTRSAPRMLTTEELIDLSGDPSIEIGAHSVTHAALPALPPAAQRNEIAASKASLERLLDRPVASFAYPYGQSSAETVSMVRDAGFARACTTRPGTVERGTGLLDLPRFAAQDWTGDEFARQLERCFE
jgi:peptidoglycan/xylan/chitin deacetylase (PgdA/CDA1 family)